MMDLKDHSKCSNKNDQWLFNEVERLLLDFSKWQTPTPAVFLIVQMIRKMD